LKALGKMIDRSGMDKDVTPYLKSIMGVILKVLLLVTIAGILGVETTTFAAAIAAIGLAIGLALQGTLGHLASGLMILIFKPYSVGDLVDMQGQLGHIKEIQIFNTIMTSLDSKTVIVPNGTATSGIITNLSREGHLRVDLNAAIAYEEDFEKVKGIIMGAINQTPKVLKSPQPTVAIEKLDEHSVLIAVRPYSTVEDYWDVYFGVYENMKKELGKAGIKVPYPRREITQS